MMAIYTYNTENDVYDARHRHDLLHLCTDLISVLKRREALKQLGRSSEKHDCLRGVMVACLSNLPDTAGVNYPTDFDMCFSIVEDMVTTILEALHKYADYATLFKLHLPPGVVDIFIEFVNVFKA